MGSASQELVYSAAAGLCVFGVALYFGSVYRDYALERLARGGETGEAGSFTFRVLKPFARFFGHLISSAAVRMRVRLGGRAPLPADAPADHFTRMRLALQRLLVAAGSPEGLTADEMLGLGCFSAVAWTCLGALMWALTGASFPVLVGLVIGVLQPVVWLRRRLARRRREIRKLLPYSLDLLTLSVEAGLDFTSALGRLVPKLAGSALAAELGEMLRAIRLGKPRSEALREMADRVAMGEVASFAVSLIQADELGSDLGPVLRIQAEQMRSDRANRAEKKAMEAPVKILFPLIVFIFPTVFLIIFSGIGIEYLKRLFFA